MNVRRQVGLYAKALFDLARERGELITIHREIIALRTVVESSPEVRNFLGEHLLTEAQRRTILEKLFKAQVRPITFLFLLQMEKARLLSRLPALAHEFDCIYWKFAGVTRVEITTAYAWDDNRRMALLPKLIAQFGRSMQPVYREDRTLIGGFRVQAGDRIFDYSVVSQLQNLGQRWREI